MDSVKSIRGTGDEMREVGVLLTFINAVDKIKQQVHTGNSDN